MRELWIVLFCLLTAPVFGQFEFAAPPEPAKCECNCAERLAKLEARIAALEAKGDTVSAAKRTVSVRVVGWTGCKTCPLIKKWAIPYLTSQGYAVRDITVTSIQPERGKIYPYFEFDICTDTTCTTIPVMVPTVETVLTREWLEREMVAKGIK